MAVEIRGGMQAFRKPQATGLAGRHQRHLHPLNAFNATRGLTRDAATKPLHPPPLRLSPPGDCGLCNRFFGLDTHSDALHAWGGLSRVSCTGAGRGHSRRCDTPNV
ncbi:hypothetical protein AAFF_G00327730 [Aldrovandia affinis]|uniref:Uncharacterized protein n=1 Tax=Aldrovandia affinis TaxID=143900 RepID=A0AAD7X1J6_9TELE|nr:hypothetical protein AAFF_G00327730 [Aldrovandia affinis]